MTTATRQPAADPLGKPAKPTIIFDGECRFCRKQVDRIRLYDRHNLFDYVPRQTEGLDDRFPQLREGDFNTGLRLIEPDGAVSIGADGIYQIARRLPRLWMVAWLYRVPGLTGVFRRMYGWIARNRFKLAGKCAPGDAACRLP